MLTNGFLKNKGGSKLIQKAILAGIGVASSKELIKKAALGLYDDIQKVVTGLLVELEGRGEIKAKETKHIIKELQKQSEIEKSKISEKLKRGSKGLIKRAKDIILTFKKSKAVFKKKKSSKKSKKKKS